MKIDRVVYSVVVIMLLLIFMSWFSPVYAGGGTCTSNSDCADGSNMSCDCVGAACGWIDTFCRIPPGREEGTCSSVCRHTGGVSCFPAGTKVMMESGEERDIEQVKIGEKVVSQNVSGGKAVSRVSQVENPIRDHVCRVEFHVALASFPWVRSASKTCGLFILPLDSLFCLPYTIFINY